MSGTDSTAETATDRTDTDAPHSPNPVREGLGVDYRLEAILETAVGLFRARPIVLLPFLLAGLLGAVSTLARRASPFPIGVAPFPEPGLLQFRLPVVPSLEPVADVTPALFLGLKPRFIAVFVGWQAICSAVAAVAFAACLWIAVDRDGIPPLERIGWLVAYAIAVDGAGFAVVYVLRQIANPGVTLLVLPTLAPIVVAIFLTPASIVLGGHRPRTAIRESVRFASEYPIAIPVILLGLGYVGYALTGVAQFAPDSALGTAAGAVVSVTVAGTAHALVVAASYRLRPIPVEE